jgi:hypothetical protein
VQTANPYPYLAHLFHSYFHQDALDDGQTHDEVIREFVETSHLYDVLGTRADILRFLHQHRADTDFLGTLNRTFSLYWSIGKTDDEARAWLTGVQNALQKMSAI